MEINIFNEFKEEHNMTFERKGDGAIICTKKEEAKELQHIIEPERSHQVVRISQQKAFKLMKPYKEEFTTNFSTVICSDNRGYIDNGAIIKDVKIFLDGKEVPFIPENKYVTIKIVLKNGNIIDMGRLGKALIYDKFKDFDISLVRSNEYVIDKGLIIFCLSITGEGFEFSGIRKQKKCEGCEKACNARNKNILFLADFAGNIAFQRIFRELYVYSKDFIIGKTFENKVFALNMQKLTEKEINEVSTTSFEIVSSYGKELPKKYFFMENIISKEIVKRNWIYSKEANEKWGILNLTKNEWIIPANYEFFYCIEEYIIAVKKDIQEIYKIEETKETTGIKKVDKINSMMPNFIRKIMGDYAILEEGKEESIVSIKTSKRLNKDKQLEFINFFGERYILMKKRGLCDISDIIDLQSLKFIILQKNINEDYKYDVEINKMMLNNSATILQKLISKSYNDLFETRVLYSSSNNIDYLIFMSSENSVIMKVQNKKYSFYFVENIRCKYLAKNWVIAKRKKDRFWGVWDIETLIAQTKTDPEPPEPIIKNIEIVEKWWE